MSAAPSVQLFLLAGVVFFAFGTLVTAALVRLFAERLARWDPRSRHRVVVLLAALPALFAVALLFAASLPSVVALFVPALDHCAAHDDGHAHLCFVHLPPSGLHPGLVLLLVFLASYTLLRVSLAAWGVARATRIVTSLAITGEVRRDLGIILVDTARPVCFTAGILRPRVFFSRSLFDSLSSEDRAVVLAHERAHVHRMDAFVGGLVRALAVLHLPGIGGWLVREAEIAAEQSCDEEAARIAADRVAVAAVILAVERVAQRAAARELDAVTVAFGARAVERRVASLLEAPAPLRSLRPLALCLGAALLAPLVLSDELHHLTETALSVFAH